MRYVVPEVGAKIEVEMECPALNSPRAYNVPDSKIYRGTVLKSFKWLEQDEFCLSTDDPLFPVRVLDAKLIRSLRSDDGEVNKVAAATRPAFECWTVEGSKGNVYTVRLEAGKFSCDCVAGGFGRHCRHVDQIKEQIGQ